MTAHAYIEHAGIPSQQPAAGGATRVLQAAPVLLLLLAMSLTAPAATLSHPTTPYTIVPTRTLSQDRRDKPILSANALPPPPPAPADSTQLLLILLKRNLKICDTAAPASPTDLSKETKNLLNLLPSWQLGTRLSTWDGITQDSDGRVIGVRLLDKDTPPGDLCFALPDEWARLTSLKSVLFLCQACVAGSLPPAWSTHPALQEVRVADQNFLRGSLPDSWSALTQLTALQMGDMPAVTGTLPTSWSTLANLKDLRLYNNYLEGPLPDSWGTLTSLLSLDLSDNQFTGTLPTSWHALSLLNVLNIMINHLSGSLPAEWSKLKKLATFTVTSNSLQGTLPAEWSQLKKLATFTAANNSLHGPLPASWNALSSLAQLDLQYNILDGPLPQEWGALSALTDLRLTGNCFSGDVPESWNKLPPINLGTEQDIMKCVLLSYKVRATFAATAAGSLCSVAAFDTWDAGTNFSDWQGLTFESNPGAGEESSQQTTLTGLTLEGAGLCGQLPSSWSLFTSLEVLNLNNNSFMGPIPDSWSNLQKLSVLNLSQNVISSSLPVNLTALPSLVSLDLSENRLTGALLADWSSIKTLAHLDLSNNYLQGSLSPQWAMLSGLTHLDLSGNTFTGGLPLAWSRLTRLTLLSLRSPYRLGSQNLQAMARGRVRLGDYVGDAPGALRSGDVNGGAGEVDTAYPRTSPDASNVDATGVSPVNNTGPVSGMDAGVSPQGAAGGMIQGGGLTGSLPAVWRNMSGLKVLDLSWNELGGPLPVEWSDMGDLVKLGLEGNILSGRVPWEWQSLEKLTYLVLGWNQLDGALPVAWAGLSALQVLSLQGNNLTGGIPSSWSALSQLTQLELGENRLNDTLFGVPSNLNHLVYLDLHSNLLQGPLPSNWATTLKNLTHLKLSSNNLTANIPPDWSKLSHLSDLVLGFNSLSGTLPTWVSVLTSLTRLDFTSNRLGGSLSPALSALKHLQHLAVADNPLAGPLAAEWSAIVNLTALDVSNCSLTGTLPSEWSRLTRLQVLNVSNNFLEGTLPANWGNTMFKVEIIEPEGITKPTAQPEDNSTTPVIDPVLSSQDSSPLPVIDLMNNLLTGDVPPTWANMSSLSSLKLARNQFKAPLPAWLSDLEALSHVDLSHNQFSGVLPSSWSQLTSLTHLSLSNNSISGPLPDPWSYLVPHLRILSLNHNQLTGSIPTNWTLCDAQCLASGNDTVPSANTTRPSKDDTSVLKSATSTTTNTPPTTKWDKVLYVDISANHLNGPLPPLPSSAVYLDASFNSFTGSINHIPDSLVYLNLGHNKLEGSIPSLNSTSLIYLNLASNSLTRLPDTLVAPRLVFINLSNNSLSGTMPPLRISSRAAQSIMVKTPADSAGVPADSAGVGSITGDAKEREYIMGAAQYVNFSSNQLPGSMPPSWFQTDYVVLDIGGNKLTGPLPDTWTGSFNILQLHDNFLTGCVPTTWPTNNSLVVLSLRNNNMSCALPVTWGNQSGQGVASVGAGGASSMGSSTASSGSLLNLALLDLDNSGMKGPIPFTWLQADSFGPDTILRLGNLWSESRRQDAWRRSVCLQRWPHKLRSSLSTESTVLTRLGDSLQKTLTSALANATSLGLSPNNPDALDINLGQLVSQEVANAQDAPTVKEICVNPRVKLIVTTQWCSLGFAIMVLFTTYVIVVSCRQSSRQRTYCCSGFLLSKATPDFPTYSAAPRQPGPVAEAYDGVHFGYADEEEEDVDDDSMDKGIRRYTHDTSPEREGGFSTSKAVLSLDDLERGAAGGRPTRAAGGVTAPFVLERKQNRGHAWLTWLVFFVHVASYWFGVGSDVYLLLTLLTQNATWWVLYLLAAVVGAQYVVAAGMLAWRWHRPVHPQRQSTHSRPNHAHSPPQHLDSQSPTSADRVGQQIPNTRPRQAAHLWLVDAIILLPILPMVDLALLLVFFLQCAAVLPPSNARGKAETRSHAIAGAGQNPGRLQRVVSHWREAFERRAVWALLLQAAPGALLQSVIFVVSNTAQLTAGVLLDERVYLVSAIGSCWQIVWVIGWVLFGAALQESGLGGRVRALMFGDCSRRTGNSRLAARDVKGVSGVGKEQVNGGHVVREVGMSRPAGIIEWD